MRSIDVRVDVGPATGLAGDPFTMSTVHLPDAVDGPARVIFAYPGAGYSRRYFDIDAKPGYSQAAFHTGHGAVVVATDHLFVGESSLGDPFDATYDNVAAANDATAAAILDQLRSGVLAGLNGDQEVGSVDVVCAVGIGQSMGGCFLTVQQANHRTFDGVAFLGWSGIETNFPSPAGGRLIFPAPPRGTDLRPIAQDLANLGAEVVQHYEYCFHWPDEDPELLRADLDAYDPAFGRVRGDGTCRWGSATTPGCAFTMVQPGTVAPEAMRIDVPVLSASGERDVVPDAWAEPTAYRSSRDVTVAVFPQMAHMHNFANTRQLLWKRLAGWVATIEG
jgi:pimeloyl-ACP methyl ester carboxylesterase